MVVVGNKVVNLPLYQHLKRTPSYMYMTYANISTTPQLFEALNAW